MLSVPATGIWTPWVIDATWLSSVNNLGLEIVFPKPSFSKASIWSFKTAEPVFLRTPIPLVAPIALKLYIPSEPALPAALIPAVPEEISAPDPDAAPTVVPPTVPPILSDFLV